MHRTDAPGNVGNQFVDGDPSSGVKGTRVVADWLNSIQEEIANLIEYAGITLDKPTLTQLKQAIIDLLATKAGIATNHNITGTWEWQDNVKANFGNSVDMSIYHSGSHSYIDSNTFDLYLRGLNNNASDILLQANDDGVLQNALTAISNASGSYFVGYHGGSEVVRSISGGIDVTGHINVDPSGTTPALHFEAFGGGEISVPSGDALSIGFWDGATYVESLRLQASGFFIPGTDNAQRLGDASNRWSTVYAGTGTINTSDERAKTEILPIDDRVLSAWSDVRFCVFKYIESVSKKGDSARVHAGVIAQDIEKAFKKHGLNAFDYGILCYDEWEDEFKEWPEKSVPYIIFSVDFIDENKKTKTIKYKLTGDDISKMPNNAVIIEEGNKVIREAGRKQIRWAGNSYGVRADQCLFLEAELHRRKLKSLEERLAALELKNSGGK